MPKLTKNCLVRMDGLTLNVEKLRWNFWKCTINITKKCQKFQHIKNENMDFLEMTKIGKLSGLYINVLGTIITRYKSMEKL